MADDNDLEKRAIEELLRETSRARVRVETMGPSGWMKCPLHSTNKRFLVNTLRSSGLQRRSDGPTAGRSATRGCLRSDSLPGDECQDRTPPPPRDLSPRDRSNGSHRPHGRHFLSRNEGWEPENGHKSGHFHREGDGRRPAKDRDTETQKLHSGHSSCSSRGHSPSRECSRGSQWGRTRSRSPARCSQSGSSQK